MNFVVTVHNVGQSIILIFMINIIDFSRGYYTVYSVSHAGKPHYKEEVSFLAHKPFYIFFSFFKASQ